MPAASESCAVPSSVPAPSPSASPGSSPAKSVLPGPAAPPEAAERGQAPLPPPSPSPPVLPPGHGAPSAVQRLAASRQRLHAALYPPSPPSLAARVQAAWVPSVQRHPWAWVLAAGVAGGVGAHGWRHLPRAWVAALSGVLKTAGQDALLAWCLGALTRAEPPPGPASTAAEDSAPATSPPTSTPAPTPTSPNPVPSAPGG